MPAILPSMMAATYSVYISTRRQVLLHADANPNCKDTFGITPLIHASARGHFDMVQMLLQATAAQITRASKSSPA